MSHGPEQFGFWASWAAAWRPNPISNLDGTQLRTSRELVQKRRDPRFSVKINSLKCIRISGKKSIYNPVASKHRRGPPVGSWNLRERGHSVQESSSQLDNPKISATVRVARVAQLVERMTSMWILQSGSIWGILSQRCCRKEKSHAKYTECAFLWELFFSVFQFIIFELFSVEELLGPLDMRTRWGTL